jgi:DNA-binding MarR family transcriptional regulator
MKSASAWFMDVARQIRNALFRTFSLETKKHYETIENLDGYDLFLSQTAVDFAPEPIGLAHAYKRRVYANPERLREGFAEAVQRGWLVRDKDNEAAYRPSEKAVALVEHINAITKERLAEAVSLPDGDLERVTGLLGKVVTAADQGNLFEEKYALYLMHKTDPPADASLVQRARQPVLQLLAYRDDAHIAAWAMHQLEGNVLETLTYLWRSEGYTAAELNEKLSFRNYKQADYEKALQELAQRGWVVAEGDSYRITPEGQNVREAIEAQTNLFFDAPFEALSDAEKQELEELLNRWAAALQPETATA